MLSGFPPLDVHTHIDPTIQLEKLLALRSVVLVATRSLNEYAHASTRVDPLAIWGVGVHPGSASAIDGFSPQILRQHLDTTPLISEVGLDRRSKVGLHEQTRVFNEVLDTHDDHRCITSVHSSGRTAEVLETIANHRAATIILHWWRGSSDETLLAVNLGCYFSFNPRDEAQDSVLQLIPPDRLLTETDHPYGDAGMTDAQPGATDSVERRIAKHGSGDGRSIVWSNFRRLVETADILDRLPPRVANMILAVPPSGTNVEDR